MPLSLVPALVISTIEPALISGRPRHSQRTLRSAVPTRPPRAPASWFASSVLTAIIDEAPSDPASGRASVRPAVPSGLVPPVMPWLRTFVTVL